MWSGFDPDLRQQLEVMREMVALQRLTPTREWPLVYVEGHDAVLVIREWPNGSMTSYTMSDVSNLPNRRLPPQPEP
jgi:hypothetical protein